MRKLSLLSLAAAAAFAFAIAPAQADVLVNADAGSLGTFKLTNNGQLGNGDWSYTLNLEPIFEQTLLSINGVDVGQQQAAFGAELSFTVTGGVSGLIYQVASATLTKTFFSPEVGGQDASLTYTLLSGATGDAAIPGTPGLDDVLNLAGLINGIGETGAILDLVGGPYDFSSMVGGDIVISLTGQTYGGTGGNQSMGAVMRTAGATVTGGVSEYSQGAVPEPTSVALMGIGLSGLLFYRRRMAKRSLAA